MRKAESKPINKIPHIMTIPPVKLKYPKRVGPKNPPKLAIVLTNAIPTAAVLVLNDPDSIAKNGPVKLYNPIDAIAIQRIAIDGLVENPLPINPNAASAIGILERSSLFDKTIKDC